MLPLALAFFGVLTVLGSLLAIRYPGVAFGIAASNVVLVQFGRAAGGPFLSYRYLPYVLIMLPGVVAITSRLLRGERIIGPLGAGAKSLYLLFFFSFATFIWHVDPEVAIPRVERVMFIVLAGYLFIPFLVGDFQQLRQAFVAFLLVGVSLLILFATVVPWGHRGLLLDIGIRDVDTNPLGLGNWAANIMLVALLYHAGRYQWLWRFLRWGVIVLAAWVAFRTGTRGAVIAAFAVGICFYPVVYRVASFRRFFGAMTGVFVLLILFGYLLDTLAGETNRWTIARLMFDLEVRLVMARLVLDAWAEAGPVAWLLGLGQTASFSDQVAGFYPHLVSAEILGEKGLVGFVLWLIAIAFTFYHGSRLIRMVYGADEARSLASLLLAIFTFLLMLTFKESDFLALGAGLFVASLVIISRLHQQVAAAQARSMVRNESFSHGQGPTVALTQMSGPS